MLFIPLVLLIWATLCDLRSRQIPDVIACLMIVWAIWARLSGRANLPWWAMGAGFGLGLVLGLIAFRLGALGGGDVKIIVAIGCGLGPVLLLAVLFFMGLAGAVLAIIAHLRSESEFAYMPAITFGFVMTAFLVGGVPEWV